ncbi:ABC transporter ATP-binding protein [Clostridium sp. AT4]|jgi:ATP-binding cassette subfamily B protein|uniref:ABC transporter ATP-binding protein n=1 Tax=Clostridium sp. AT4 TaxID=1720194 RepID=UPI00082D73E7|nr:ABC transporter ATP-binding protein [Clostridium sp. AT4]
MDRYQEMERRFAACYQKHGKHSVRVLLEFYRGQYHKFLLSTLFFLLKHSPALLSPLLIANVVNGVIEGGEAGSRAIFINVGIWLGLLSIHLPANWIHNQLKSRVIRNTEAGLRAALVRKLQELSIPYHTGSQSGRLQSKIMRDVEAVETLSSQLFVNMLNIVMNLVITLSITAVKNRLILVFFVLVAPVAAGAVVAFRTKIHRENRSFRQGMEETSARVMEMVEMVPVARAHALEDKEAARISALLEETANRGYRLDMVQAHFGAVSWVVFQVFQVVCLAVSGFMAMSGLIKVGDVTFYQSSFTTVVNQFSALINLLPILTKGLESVSSIGEVLSSDEVEKNEGKEELASLKGEYSFKQVSFSYPDSDREVLHGLEFTVKQGETIALVGESGSGKTTILNMLIGFILPSGGQLLLDGKDMKGLNLRTYRRFLSVVPQTPVLFTGTVRENITYGLEHVSEEQIAQAVEAANLSEVIKRLPQGLDTMIEEHGANLSGGQRQRISIARALIRNPQVIILDEATSALDSISESEIQEALERLTKGRTTFIVAHRLSTVRGADRILVIGQGRIREQGSYQELMAKKGEFYQMEQLQRMVR